MIIYFEDIRASCSNDKQLSLSTIVSSSHQESKKDLREDFFSNKGREGMESFLYYFPKFVGVWLSNEYNFF